MNREEAMGLAQIIAQVRRLIPSDEPFQKVLDTVAAHQGRWIATTTGVVRLAHYTQRANRGRPSNFESSRPDLTGASLEDAFIAGWDARDEQVDGSWATWTVDEYKQAYAEWRRSI